jgi:hypothetical protein
MCAHAIPSEVTRIDNSSITRIYTGTVETYIYPTLHCWPACSDKLADERPALGARMPDTGGAGERARMLHTVGAGDSPRPAADALVSARGRVIVVCSEGPLRARDTGAGARRTGVESAGGTGVESAGGTGVTGALAQSRALCGWVRARSPGCARSQTCGAYARTRRPLSRSRCRSRWGVSSTRSRPCSRLRQSGRPGCDARSCLARRREGLCWTSFAARRRRVRGVCAGSARPDPRSRSGRGGRAAEHAAALPSRWRTRRRIVSRVCV